MSSVEFSINKSNQSTMQLESFSMPLPAKSLLINNYKNIKRSSRSDIIEIVYRVGPVDLDACIFGLSCEYL